MSIMLFVLSISTLVALIYFLILSSVYAIIYLKMYKKEDWFIVLNLEFGYLVL